MPSIAVQNASISYPAFFKAVEVLKVTFLFYAMVYRAEGKKKESYDRLQHQSDLENAG